MSAIIATEPVTSSIKRYHPTQVVLHWIIAALILITAWLAISQGEEGRRQAAAGIAGIPTLGIHMILGVTVLVLLLIRLVVRWRTTRPEWATTGSTFLDRVGQWTHIGLYFFAFAVTLTGLILALQTNRLARVFSGEGNPPGRFGPGQFQPGQFPPPGAFPPGNERAGGFDGGPFGGGRFFLGAFHGFSWTILLLLILLHVAAALYHQFFRRDHLLGRMWFGRTT
jgi:cytochrome b561